MNIAIAIGIGVLVTAGLLYWISQPLPQIRGSAAQLGSTAQADALRARSATSRLLPPAPARSTPGAGLEHA